MIKVNDSSDYDNVCVNQDNCY